MEGGKENIWTRMAPGEDRERKKERKKDPSISSEGESSEEM